jgi:putative MFS transporter
MVQKGFDVSASLLYVGASFIAPIASNAAAAFVADRWGRKSILVATALAMTLLGPVFALSNDFTMLLVIGALFTMAAATYVPVFLLFAAEGFPPARRPQANAFGWAVNRAMSAMVPLVLVPVLKAWGVAAAFGLLAATTVAIILVLAVRGRAVVQDDRLVAAQG